MNLTDAFNSVVHIFVQITNKIIFYQSPDKKEQNLMRPLSGYLNYISVSGSYRKSRLHGVGDAKTVLKKTKMKKWCRMWIQAMIWDYNANTAGGEINAYDTGKENVRKGVVRILLNHLLCR